MPVDIFGKTTGSNGTTTTVTGEIDIAKLNAEFLRRDGGNFATGNIDLDDNKLVNVNYPVDPFDAANRDFVEIVAAVEREFTKETDADNNMSATPTMIASSTTIGDYTYQSSSNTTTESSWRVYRNQIDGSGGWVGAPNVLTGYNQLKFPFPVSMKGLYIIPTNEVGRVIDIWQITASNNEVDFIDITPATTQPLLGGVLSKLEFNNTTKYKIWRFNILQISGSINIGINTMQWIPTIPDKYLLRNNVSYVPRQIANVNYQGFFPFASSELNTNTLACNAFNCDYGTTTSEWRTNGETTDFTLAIDCPTPVRIWKVGLTGLSTPDPKILSWQIEGLNPASSWYTLYKSEPSEVITNLYREVGVDSVVSFKSYRFRGLGADPPNPGLTTFKLFVYDDNIKPPAVAVSTFNLLSTLGVIPTLSQEPVGLTLNKSVEITPEDNVVFQVPDLDDFMKKQVLAVRNIKRDNLRTKLIKQFLKSHSLTIPQKL
jgi:hypothetical protein